METDDSIPINVDTLKLALNKVGEYLGSVNKHYQLVCTGGVISLLYFKSRESTDDVDVIFPPSPESSRLLKKIITTVGEELNLNKNWMNDSIRFFGLETRSNNVIFKHKGLTLVAAKWEELLSHKINAYRNIRDTRDAALIMKEIGKTDKEKLFHEVLKYKPITPYVKDEEMRRRFDEVWAIVNKVNENLLLKKVGLLTEAHRKFKSTALSKAA